MKKTHVSLMLGGLTITVFLLAMVIYSNQSSSWVNSSREIQTYERNYALVSADHSQLWQTIYDSASETAHKDGATLEWIGQNIPGSYTTAECLQIAIASSPDGILLYNESADQVTDLLEEASELGIPVINVMNDEPDAPRTGYVGLNAWQLGDTYGAQVRAALKKGSNKITILSASPKDSESANILYVRMSQKIQDNLPEGTEVSLDYREVDTSLSFNVEETIRDLFVRKDQTPDILVCLDAMSTECALQEVIDYSEVGNVKLFGYYTAEDTIDALQKGIMEATIAVDAKQIGRTAVESLSEYINLGYVSDYNTVQIKLVDERNAAEYLPDEITLEEEDATS